MDIHNVLSVPGRLELLAEKDEKVRELDDCHEKDAKPRLPA